MYTIVAYMYITRVSNGFKGKNRGVQGVVNPPLGAMKTIEVQFKLEY